jgi:hypothetical protein
MKSERLIISFSVTDHFLYIAVCDGIFVQLFSLFFLLPLCFSSFPSLREGAEGGGGVLLFSVAMDACTIVLMNNNFH